MTSVIEPSQVIATPQIKALLDNINWSFSTPFSVGRSGIRLFDCRKYHWYPATFIPEIPYTLIEMLSTPDAVVYDPFAGIGTTVFQSLLLGRQPYATEVGGIAVQFIRSMWQLLCPATNIAEVEPAFTRLISGYDAINDYRETNPSVAKRMAKLEPWFAKSTLNQLAYLAAYENEWGANLQAALPIALSATLKAVCSQDRGWGCIADNVLPKPQQRTKERDAFGRCSLILHTLVSDLAAIRSTLPDSTTTFLSSIDVTSRIAQEDVRRSTLVPDHAVDLLITSPPYPNMTDYALSQRLSYYWFDLDPVADLSNEIGARRKRFSQDAITQYTREMREAFEAMRHKVKYGGYACFVLPAFTSNDEKSAERRKSVQEPLASLLGHGFTLEHEVTRLLPTRRRHHNQKWTSLEQENVFVYRKVDK